MNHISHRPGNGVGGIGGGDPYFGSFFQGPYQSLNYNSLPGANGAGAGGAGDVGGFPDNFERDGGFRSAFAGGLPFSNVGFGPAGGFFSGFGDSSLRASQAKETVSQTDKPQQQDVDANDKNIDEEQTTRPNSA